MSFSKNTTIAVGVVLGLILAISIAVLVLVSKQSKTFSCPPQLPLLSTTTTDWVVARYTEDVLWMTTVFDIIPGLKRVFIYNKGEPLDSEVLQTLQKHTQAAVYEIPLPNVGREGETFLQYLVSFYDDLPDVVLFSQAYFYDKKPAEYWIPLFSNPAVSVQEIVGFDIPCGLTHAAHHAHYSIGKKTTLSIGEFADTYFRMKTCPPVCSQYGVFKTSRHKIQRYTKKDYVRVLTETGFRTCSNPEEGYYLERLWYWALCSDLGADYDAFKQGITCPDLQNNPLYHSLANAYVSSKGLVLEFGDFTGKTINKIASALPHRTIYGFENGDHFSLSLRSNVALNKSLPVFKKNVIRPGDTIALLHVDTDSYSSTKTIFDELGDFMTDGTVIVFDTLFNYPNAERHNLLAFYEYLQSHNFSLNWIGKYGFSAAVRLCEMKTAPFNNLLYVK